MYLYIQQRRFAAYTDPAYLLTLLGPYFPMQRDNPTIDVLSLELATSYRFIIPAMTGRTTGPVHLQSVFNGFHLSCAWCTNTMPHHLAGCWPVTAWASFTRRHPQSDSIDMAFSLETHVYQYIRARLVE